MRYYLNEGLPINPPEILFILGIMKIEAWILAEYNHFFKMHPAITVERIKDELKIDLINDELSQRSFPSKDLKEIYWLEKINYWYAPKKMDSILNF